MSDNGFGVGDRLRQYLERIERLRAEIAQLKAQEKDVFTQAASAGFDKRTMRDVLKWRALTEQEREEREGLFDAYRAALGMLGDTPLGAAALRRFQAPDADPRDKPLPFAPPHHPPPEAPLPPTPEEILAAKAEGAAAAKAGRPVLDNPYSDARRAAWDEGWCAASGTDGMDIPPAFRRATPKRKGRGAGGDGAGADA